MAKINEERSMTRPYTQNRELSWLMFNRRVLDEAADSTVPIFERLKFVSIFSSNLDEFFMVRVGSLFDIDRISPDETDNKTGWTAKQQLKHIYKRIPELIADKAVIYGNIEEKLRQSGIRDLDIDELDHEQLKAVHRFFITEIMPILSPIIIGPHHPVPHMPGKQLHAAALLKDKKSKLYVGIAALPENVPPYIILPGSPSCYVRTENILKHMLPVIFDPYTVQDSCVLCVTRNADISFDDEKFDDDESDFRQRVSDMLKKRATLSVVRLELDSDVGADLKAKLKDIVKVSDEQIFVDKCPLNMKYVFRLISELPKDVTESLLYKPYTPRWPEDIRKNGSIIDQVRKQDRLLFYPFDSVEPFLKLLNEAADDPDVLSLSITIYRLASSSRIAQTLSRAASNGKKVLVLMELRARFDEANNLEWSSMLEAAGCQVIYGMEGFKCHSKICLIKMRSRGKISYITQIGTGNYNEKTNAMYTDLSLMTASEKIGEDAAAFFRNMLVNNTDGTYHSLAVSPYGIKAMLCAKIDEQMKLGKLGYICIKANSVTELEVMDKLSEASRAGVEVHLIIRGICCLLPGVKGYTDNISVVSIVGRYLEHARIYMFGRGSNADIYIASADLMTRNLNRRVEIACPVYDPAVREQLRWILSCQLKDTAKQGVLMSDGAYKRFEDGVRFDSQDFFMKESPHIPADEPASAAKEGLTFAKAMRFIKDTLNGFRRAV